MEIAKPLAPNVPKEKLGQKDIKQIWQQAFVSTVHSWDQLRQQNRESYVYANKWSAPRLIIWVPTDSLLSQVSANMMH